jgi:GNAT superfamily N-acetyltransferase
VSVVVREAGAADAEGIARVHTDSWRETYGGVLNQRYFTSDAFERRRDTWVRFFALQSRPGRPWVAEVDGRIVGFAHAGDAAHPDASKGFPPARSVHLFTMYVLVTELGTGVGQALLDAVIGDGPAQLWVLRGNARACAFYRRNGFTFDGSEYVDPDDPALVELRMVR